MPAVRRPFAGWGVLAVVVGATFGAVTSVTNHGQGLVADHLRQLLDAPWTWVAVGLPGCLVVRRWAGSVVLSGLTLVAAVLAYDLADLRLGTYDALGGADPRGPVTVDWGGLTGDVVVYLLVAVGTAVGLATLVRLVRRGGLLGLVAQLLVPAYTAWGSWRRVHDASLTGSAGDALVGVNRTVTALALVVLLGLLLRGLLPLVRSVQRTRLSG